MERHLIILLVVAFCATLSLAVPYPRNQDEDSTEANTTTEAPRSSSSESGAEADLLLAVNEDNLDQVNKLILHGANVNYNDGIALTYAISRANQGIVDALITAGADVNADGGDHLVAAAKGGHIDIIKALIDGGALPQYFSTAKTEAARYGYDDIVQLLTDRAAQADDSNSRHTRQTVLNDTDSAVFSPNSPNNHARPVRQTSNSTVFSPSSTTNSGRPVRQSSTFNNTDISVFSPNSPNNHARPVRQTSNSTVFSPSSTTNSGRPVRQSSTFNDTDSSVFSPSSTTNSGRPVRQSSTFNDTDSSVFSPNSPNHARPVRQTSNSTVFSPNSTTNSGRPVRQSPTFNDTDSSGSLPPPHITGEFKPVRPSRQAASPNATSPRPTFVSHGIGVVRRTAREAQNSPSNGTDFHPSVPVFFSSRPVRAADDDDNSTVTTFSSNPFKPNTGDTRVVPQHPPVFGSSSRPVRSAQVSSFNDTVLAPSFVNNNSTSRPVRAAQLQDSTSNDTRAITVSPSGNISNPVKGAANDTNGEEDDASKVESPLFKAVIDGEVTVVSSLVKEGADIKETLLEDVFEDNTTDGTQNKCGKGFTVMHAAARFDQPLVQSLLQLGADINAMDSRGNTPLQVAISENKLYAVKELLRYCADLSNKNDEGKTAADLAKEIASRNSSTPDTEKEKTLVDIMTNYLGNKLNTIIGANSKTIRDLKIEFDEITATSSYLRYQLRNLNAEAEDVNEAIVTALDEKAQEEIPKLIEKAKCTQKDAPSNEKCKCVPGNGITDSSDDGSESSDESEE